MLERVTELWEQYQRWVIIAVVIVGGGTAVLLGSGVIATAPKPDANIKAVSQIGQPPEPKVSSRVANSAVTSSTAKRLFVDVKGAVNKPGVLEVAAGARLDSILALAGGVTKKADLNQVNLAQEVQDQQIIYVPKQGEQTPAQFNNAGGTATSGVAGAGEATTEANVNLNNASKEDLQTLTGVGPSKADAIIQYREEHGQFGTIEELTEVTGFGEKTFEKLKDKLSV
ncbi:competence protein [Periweissella cryptocerci]|uniref:Competence protein n=1 Tax=Periweissella cryptocerci TaxID=2506420 RepID=A0A4P6YVZ0_9LACO|nr:helix-hairpin-helix domain-containing protein [Periweissella cryptocerci]QBO37002.1 competence protein [Periweissella cryptocerci]